MFQIKHIEEILKDNWEIETKEIVQLDSKVLCINKSLILKQYRDYSELQCYIKTYLYILDKCTLIPKIIKTKKDNLYFEDETVFYLLMTRIMGNDKFVASRLNVFEYGLRITDFQRLFNDNDTRNIFDEWNFLEELDVNSRSIMEKSGWRYIDENLYNSISNQLCYYYNELSVGIIHRDIHLDNFLFSDKEFLGYIDFDMTSRSILIYDICYAAFNYFRILDGIVENALILNGILKMVAGYFRNNYLKTVDRECIILVMDSIALFLTTYYYEIEAWDGIISAQKFHFFLVVNYDILKSRLNEVRLSNSEKIIV